MKGGLFLFVALCVFYVVHAETETNYDDGSFGVVKYSGEGPNVTRKPIYATIGVKYPTPRYRGRFDELRKKLHDENSQLRSIVRRDVPDVKIPENVPSIPEGIVDLEQRVIYPDSPVTPENDDISEDAFPYQKVIVGVQKPFSSKNKASQAEQNPVAATSNGAPEKQFPIPPEWIRYNSPIDESSPAVAAAAAPQDEEPEEFTIPPEWIIYNSPSAIKSLEPASYSSEEDEHSNSRSNKGRALHFTTSLNVPSLPNGINTALPSLPKPPSASSLPSFPSFPSFPSLPSLPGLSSIPSRDDMRKRGRDFIDSIVRNRRIIFPNTNVNHPPTGDSKCVHKFSLTGDDFVIDGHVYFSENCQQPGDNGAVRPTSDNAWRPNLPGFNGSPTFPGINRPPAFPGGMPGYPTPAFPGALGYPGMRPLQPHGGYMPGIKGVTPMRPGAFPGFGNGHGMGGFGLGPGRLGFGRSLTEEEETHGTEVPTEENDEHVTPTTVVNEEPKTQKDESSSTKSQDDQDKKSHETSIQIGPLKFGLGFGNRT